MIILSLPQIREPKYTDPPRGKAKADWKIQSSKPPRPAARQVATINSAVRSRLTRYLMYESL